jgi:phosphatidate cytidylyltransferase
MVKRLISALFGIPLYIGVCLWGKIPFAIGITIVALLGLIELLKTYWKQGIRPSLILAFLGLTFPAWHFLILFLPLKPLVIMILTMAMFAVGWEVIHASVTGEMKAGRNIGYGMLSGSYIALFGGLTSLRSYTNLSQSQTLHSLQVGAAYTILVALCIWATDSFAMFVGAWIGKTKLAPNLSPQKTVEGAFGGLIASVIVGLGFGAWLLGSPTWGAVIGVIAGVFGPIGDLFESALKREVGVKDFGNVMPGHGGVLDRFDSLIFAAGVLSLILYLWVK